MKRVMISVVGAMLAIIELGFASQVDADITVDAGAVFNAQAATQDWAYVSNSENDNVQASPNPLIANDSVGDTVSVGWDLTNSLVESFSLSANPQSFHGGGVATFSETVPFSVSQTGQYTFTQFASATGDQPNLQMAASVWTIIDSTYCYAWLSDGIVPVFARNLRPACHNSDFDGGEPVLLGNLGLPRWLAGVADTSIRGHRVHKRSACPRTLHPRPPRHRCHQPARLRLAKATDGVGKNA